MSTIILYPPIAIFHVWWYVESNMRKGQTTEKKLRFTRQVWEKLDLYFQSPTQTQLKSINP